MNYNGKVLLLTQIRSYLTKRDVKHHDDIQRVVNQLKSSVDHLAQESKHLKNGARFANLRKINDLRQIISSLEDIDSSLDGLLKKQSEKTSAH